MSEPNRREFLRTAGGWLSAAYVAPSAAAHHTSAEVDPLGSRRLIDTLITGGNVLDPASGVSGRRDIAITGGRISQVAPTIPRGDAARVIDATGKVVTPGLIDIHVHVYPGVANVAIEPDRV